MPPITTKDGVGFKKARITVAIDEIPMQSISRGGIVIISILLALLILTMVFGAWGWNASKDVSMDVNGWIALALGTIFSLLIGCGLMALMFISSRYGYDEQADPFREKREPE
jgi:hypothetical protein